MNIVAHIRHSQTAPADSLHLLVNQAAVYLNGRTNIALTKRAEDLFTSFLEQHAKLIFERKVGVDLLDPKYPMGTDLFIELVRVPKIIVGTDDFEPRTKALSFGYIPSTSL